MSQKEKADEMMAAAEKRLKAWFGGSAKWEDAADLYTKAANQYKIAKEWDKAGDAYCKSSECHLKLSSKHEAATNYISAATCYKKSNFSSAVQCMKQAIEFYTDEGRFSIAAKHQKELAEMYESESDFEGAITAYQQSADYYDGEGSSSSASQCLLKVALFSAQIGNYDKAIEIYEQVASSSIDNNLLKWSVKEYFLRSGLCHLAKGDVVATTRALERYQEMDATFSSQRECKFLQDILAAVSNNDVEAFTNAVVEFDSISKFDSWKTSILLKIKKSLNVEDQLT